LGSELSKLVVNTEVPAYDMSSGKSIPHKYWDQYFTEGAWVIADIELVL
jgi:hypothetical protein